ncbi:MAG: phage tail protein [Eggerthellaceae bacterium]|nr:phage tail protein [Eggerthellaceae bacterium]
MRRIMVFDRFDAPLFELAEGDVFELTRTEQVNGEHALSITTTRQLEQGNRILLQDDRGVWREYVVYGVDALHDSGERPIGTYYCTWSVQPDLMGTRVSRMPGTDSPVSAGVALDAALSGTSRWSRGTVTRTATGGASMYDTDGWDAMATLVGTWGGELSATIEVSTLSGVTARKVDLYDKMGDQTARRRFDFGADLSSVRRTIADGPLYCRITPRGKGEQTDSGGYGRKITIESVNGGKDYLEKASMVDLAKLPDGNGGWEYPTLEVENSDCETPAELLAWARSVLDDYTLPRITYEVDVLQLAREGIDMQGVGLGDAVHIVDRKFGEGLRLSGRVVAMTMDELSGNTTQLTIGYINNGLTGMFGSLGRQVSRVTAVVQQMNGGTLSTADYLSRLLDRINAEINATGGYTYITEGQGLRTYDKAVSDPLVGAEADAVVEVKGGTIRIANTKTVQGAWNWKTVFTSGHVAAELVTAAQITAGYIGSAGSGNYWDLDTGELQMAASTKVGGKTVAAIAQEKVDGQTQSSIFNKLTNDGQTQGIYLLNGLVYINGSYIKAGEINADYIKAGVISDAANKNSWNLSTGALKTKDMTAESATLTGSLNISFDPNSSGIGLTIDSFGILRWKTNGTETATLYGIGPLRSGSSGSLRLYADDILLGDKNGNRKVDISPTEILIGTDSRHFLCINSSSAYMRCGSKGFGIYNGQYSDNWTWSD